MLSLAAGLLTPSEIATALLALGLLLLVARALGEIAQKFNQPAVIGELLAGILLGPSILGMFFPDLFKTLFPKEGGSAIFLEGFAALAISLYLLVAGMEVNLSTVWKQGKAAMYVGLAGIIFPFAIGFGIAWGTPSLLGKEANAHFGSSQYDATKEVSIYAFDPRFGKRESVEVTLTSESGDSEVRTLDHYRKMEFKGAINLEVAAPAKGDGLLQVSDNDTITVTYDDEFSNSAIVDTSTPPTTPYGEGRSNLFVFALFIATALSISALPVIAKTLMDLNIFRSDFGMIIIAAAIFNDLIGWLIFALILGMMGAGSASGLGIAEVTGLTLGFAVVMLTVGRWLFNKIVPFLQAHTTWPGGILSFCLGIALLGAAFTEYIGVHAIFGAFLVGIAIGDSRYLSERTRTVLEDFISFIFAPLFFASVGLMVNFATSFDLLLCVIVMLISCVGKVVGCYLGALGAGMTKRESWGVGFGMNARGTMEIILGLLALQYGVINEKLFVALVVMALLTSVMSGPILQKLLSRRKPIELINVLSSKAFTPDLKGHTRREVIDELSEQLANATGLPKEAIADAAWKREEIIPTGVGDGLAVPHARLEALEKPVVALGLSTSGIDFNAPDGRPAQLIFMILTPLNDNAAQLDILASIGKTFRHPGIREGLMDKPSFTELLALIKTKGGSRQTEHGPH